MTRRPKLAKIGVVRKSIARVLTVYTQTQNAKLREAYAGKKFLPKDLRPKQTPLGPTGSRPSGRRRQRKRNLDASDPPWRRSSVGQVKIKYRGLRTSLILRGRTRAGWHPVKTPNPLRASQVKRIVDVGRQNGQQAQLSSTARSDTPGRYRPTR